MLTFKTLCALIEIILINIIEFKFYRYLIFSSIGLILSYVRNLFDSNYIRIKCSKLYFAFFLNFFSYTF